MITLPITQLQLVLSMAIAEIWVVSDPKYSVTIGSENYFSFAVAGVLGMFSIFLFLAIKFSHGIQFREEKVSLGNSATAEVIKNKVNFRK